MIRLLGLRGFEWSIIYIRIYIYIFGRLWISGVEFSMAGTYAKNAHP